MKTIKSTELKAGNIFCKELKLIGRVAFKCTGIVEQKETKKGPVRGYAIITERTTEAKTSKLYYDSTPYVILLHES